MSSGAGLSILVFFIPRFNEVSLFAICLSVGTLWGISPDARDYFLQGETGLASGIPLVLAGIGTALSLFHILTRRHKSTLEKIMLLAFGVMACSLVGYEGWNHGLGQDPRWLMVFPVWNMVNGVLLLLLFRFGALNTRFFQDGQARFAQIAACSVGVVGGVMIGEWGFALHPITILSISVCLSLNLIGRLVSLDSDPVRIRYRRYVRR